MSAYCSKELIILLQALEKAKTLYKTISSSVNQDFLLSVIVLHAHESLRKNDLRLLYYMETLEEDRLSLQRIQLVHATGQYLTIASHIIVKDPRKDGFKYLETNKEISGLLILGITLPNIDTNKSTELIEKITPEQYKDLMWELDDFPDVVKGILKFYTIDSLTDLPKSEFHNAKVKIRKIKKSHES